MPLSTLNTTDIGIFLNFSGCSNAELSLIRGSIIMLPILVGLG